MSFTVTSENAYNKQKKGITKETTRKKGKKEVQARREKKEERRTK